MSGGLPSWKSRWRRNDGAQAAEGLKWEVESKGGCRGSNERRHARSRGRGSRSSRARRKRRQRSGPATRIRAVLSFASSSIRRRARCEVGKRLDRLGERIGTRRDGGELLTDE